METFRLNSNNTLTFIYKNLQFSNVATQGKGDQNIYEDYQQGLKSPIETGNSEKTPTDKGQRLAL